MACRAERRLGGFVRDDKTVVGGVSKNGVPLNVERASEQRGSLNQDPETHIEFQIPQRREDSILDSEQLEMSGEAS